jgi:hypothetical protein
VPNEEEQQEIEEKENELKELYLEAISPGLEDIEFFDLLVRKG